MSEILEYDVVIIGGGPAGLTAGIYATRSMLKTVMIERMMPGGQVSITDNLENYPGFPSISGPDLINEMETQARKFGLEFNSEEVLAIELGAGTKGHLVKTDTNEYLAKTIIITSGANPRHLNCEGEETHIGKGVSYCATCDGPFFRDKEVIVAGGGDSAVKEAEYLTKFASKVTIVHRRDRFRADKIVQEKVFANKKIEYMWDSTIEAIEGDPLVSNVKIKNLKTGKIIDFKADGVFVFVGNTPSNSFVPKTINTDGGGYIITSQEMETNIPGIFAAGDIRSKELKQVITACGDAATAAFAAEKYIEWHYSDEQYL